MVARIGYVLHRSVRPLSPAEVARRFLEPGIGFRLKSIVVEALATGERESLGGTTKRMRSDRCRPEAANQGYEQKVTRTSGLL